VRQGARAGAAGRARRARKQAVDVPPGLTTEAEPNALPIEYPPPLAE
jgi:hypothetical protein